MPRPHLPPPRIDLATLPPLLATGDANSFAQFTLKVRDPKILDELIAAPYFSPDLKRAFKKLREEILDGAIQPLREDAPDIEFWRAISKQFIGRSWLDVPWFWAETFFYRRILEIVGYFQLGGWHEHDPFAALKDAELKADAAPARVRAVVQMNDDGGRTANDNDASSPTLRTLNDMRDDASTQTNDAQRFEHLLYSALWGNRVDLSYNVEQQHGRAARLADERANLLVDDAPRVWEFFATRQIKNLLYVCDNAGTELALDLAFIDLLLDRATTLDRVSTLDRASTRERPYAEKIVLHLKPQPFYVSDAMPQDVLKTLTAFENANEETRALAKRLRGHLDAKRLEMRVHWFYPTPLHFFEMPNDLFEMFRAADFAILKGDVNYRRVVGDAHWKPTIAFEYCTRYFPTPFVSLRTLKSDVIVGLSATQVEALNQADRAWRVNGKRGVAQANLGNGD